MKIVYLTNSNLYSNTAHVVNILLMCEAFAGLGNDVTLLVPDYTGSGDHKYIKEIYKIEKNFTIKFIPIIKIRFLKNFSYIIKSIINIWINKQDLLYIRMSYDYIFANIINCNAIIETHSPLHKNIIIRRMQLVGYSRKCIRKIVVITDALKQYFLLNIKSYERKFIVASDGARISNTDSNLISLKGSFKYNIGYIGHLYEGRGVELIIELAKENAEYGFHIVGGTAEHVSKWKERIRSSNLYFYGHVKHSDVQKYAINFDILIAPYQESVKVPGNIDTSKWMSPLKIFEYMAVKKPIVCSDLPVLREVLKHNVNAILCHPDDLGSWSSAINKLLIDKEYAYKISSTAYNDLVTKYSWGKRAEIILDEMRYE